MIHNLSVLFSMERFFLFGLHLFVKLYRQDHFFIGGGISTFFPPGERSGGRCGTIGFIPLLLRFFTSGGSWLVSGINPIRRRAGSKRLLDFLFTSIHRKGDSHRQSETDAANHEPGQKFFLPSYYLRNLIPMHTKPSPIGLIVRDIAFIAQYPVSTKWDETLDIDSKEGFFSKRDGEKAGLPVH